MPALSAQSPGFKILLKKLLMSGRSSLIRNYCSSALLFSERLSSFTAILPAESVPGFSKLRVGIITAKYWSWVW
jgi:hypothetical protein